MIDFGKIEPINTRVFVYKKNLKERKNRKKIGLNFQLSLLKL